MRILKSIAITLLAALPLTVVANGKLTKSESVALATELLEARDIELRTNYAKEWVSGVLTNGDYKMPFTTKVFGDEPADGRAMYISMHGGGGAPAELNDKQWDNQKKLYTPVEGLYFVPRAPTNTWNLWHQEYMDHFIEKAIALAVIYENVNPNKVYVMGYSAGGDGTYQLAPRLADHFAAAAMSAGHPGDAQIENLRNLPFALFMGAKDTPYDRNIHAQTWSDKLGALEMGDDGGYKHLVKIYPQHGHWMHRDDTVSMAWMPKFVRNPIPQKVVWIQDDVIRDNYYWLTASEAGKKQNDKIVASYTQDGRIDILEANVPSLIVGVNDAMMNLDKKITIYYKGKKIYSAKPARKAKNIEADVNAMRDGSLIFPVKIKVDLESGKASAL